MNGVSCLQCGAWNRCISAVRQLGLSSEGLVGGVHAHRCCGRAAILQTTVRSAVILIFVILRLTVEVVSLKNCKKGAKSRFAPFGYYSLVKGSLSRTRSLTHLKTFDNSSHFATLSYRTVRAFKSYTTGRGRASESLLFELNRMDANKIPVSWPLAS
jgi:hypothetical protein